MRRVARLFAILLCTALIVPIDAAQRGRRGIVVYEHAEFGGRSEVISGPMRSLRSVGLNDRISSFEIARGERWEVCEDDDFRGRCEVFTGDEYDLSRTGMNDRISSIRPVGGGGWGGGGGGWGGGGGGGRLELFENTRFDGKSIALEEPARGLGSMDMRAESLRLSGTWEICDRPDFRGRCTTISRNISDLDDIGWKERIRSARPR